MWEPCRKEAGGNHGKPRPGHRAEERPTPEDLCPRQSCRSPCPSSALQMGPAAGIRADSSGLWDPQTGCARDPGPQSHRTGTQSSAGPRQRALPAVGRSVRWTLRGGVGTVGRAGGCVPRVGAVCGVERFSSSRVRHGSGLQPSGWCPALGVGLRGCPCDGVNSGGAPLVPPQGSPELPGGQGGPRNLRDRLGGAVLCPRGPADSSGSRNPAVLAGRTYLVGREGEGPPCGGRPTEGTCLPALVPH